MTWPQCRQKQDSLELQDYATANYNSHKTLTINAYACVRLGILHDGGYKQCLILVRDAVFLDIYFST
jgi:hypothetical protein